MTRFSLFLCFALSLASCRSVGDFVGLGPAWVAVDTQSGESVDLDRMADDLAQRDVVFLGEEHDSTIAHELQLALTQKLHERRGEIVVTLEMFERDVDFDLEDYLAGLLTEEEFLSDARPWSNYEEHYRPLVEWARAAGVRVVAGNIPRPVARRVAYEGIAAVRKAKWMPDEFEAPRGEYYDRFARAMGAPQRKLDPDHLYRWYSAQCAKDEVMAESIVRYARGSTSSPLVIHWCGKFHSDYGLGTAERVARRNPDLRLGVVSTRSGHRTPARLTEEELGAGDYVWLVRTPRGR